MLGVEELNIGDIMQRIYWFRNFFFNNRKDQAFI